jgi:hypothetical protein
MIKSSIEKLSESIGFDIGMSDDVTQANLLNGFSNALANSTTPHQLELQLCYVVEKLDSKAEMVLKKMVEFIELKQKK